MKRLILIPIIAALLVFACNKSEESQNNGTLSNGTDAVLSAADTGFSAGKYGYILRVNASLMVLENDTGSESDKTRWAVSMALGDRVSVGEARRATWDGRVYDFTEIRRDDGTEGLAFTTQVAEGGRLAVVVDDRANLYRSARAVDAIGTTIPRKTIVVAFPETERDGFVEIRAYDAAAGITRQNYVRTNTLSEREADIQSSILLQTAEPLRNEGAEKNRKDVLLESALLDYPNSVFSAEIMALLYPNTTATIQTEPASHHIMVVNDDAVNVWDLPDPFAAKVIGQLSREIEVTVDLQTANATTINGQSARWYHITIPTEGWIFGAYLE